MKLDAKKIKSIKFASCFLGAILLCEVFSFYFVENTAILLNLPTPVLKLSYLCVCSIGLYYFFVFSENLKHEAAESKLRVADAVFQIRDAVMVTDVQGQILRVNEAFEAFTGYQQHEVLGQNPRVLSSGLHNKSFYQKMWSAVLTEGRWKGELWDKTKSGVIYPKLTTITAVKNETEETTHYVAIFTAISQKAKSDEEILRLAYYDPLTALPNRRLLLDRLKSAIATTKRSKQYAAVLFLDLDNFKSANDRYGHQQGDQILTEVARRITSCIREVDTVARFGGDEFVVLLENVGTNKQTAQQNVSKVAEVIRVQLSQSYLENKVCDISSSIGIAMFKNGERTPEGLLEEADVAMYHAKHSGRNQVCFLNKKQITRPAIQLEKTLH